MTTILYSEKSAQISILCLILLDFFYEISNFYINNYYFTLRLTFYVNAKGQLHVFINSEHKGAILVGIPVKEQLWIVLDLYGTTVSVKFISNCE